MSKSIRRRDLSLYLGEKSSPKDQDQTVAKEFLHSGALSESYAFLIQKICLSSIFLQDVLGLSEKDARNIADVHKVKWLALARRYAAKLVIEVDNFQEGRLQKGEKHYAQIMQRETGFHYDPETYLFDLMPDFYSCDYFQAFMEADRGSIFP